MERARQSTYTLQHPHSRVTGEEKVNTWTQTGEEKINTWTQTGEEKVNMWTQRGATTIFTINCENQDSNSRPWALIPCQASCTSQRNQKSELMERARQFTYTHQQNRGDIHMRRGTEGRWRSPWTQDQYQLDSGWPLNAGRPLLLRLLRNAVAVRLRLCPLAAQKALPERGWGRLKEGYRSGRERRRRRSRVPGDTPPPFALLTLPALRRPPPATPLPAIHRGHPV
jgi:hypothetical protein